MTTADKTLNKKEIKKKKITASLMPVGYDGWLYAAMILLAIFDIAMVASASMGLAVGNNRYLLTMIIKQVIFVTAGYLGMALLANRFTLKFLKSDQFPSVIIITVILLLACLLFPGVDGARAWLRARIAGVEVSIQPSEFAKITSILVVAAYTGDIQKKFPSDFQMLKRPLLFIGLFVFITLIAQSDFGSAMVIFLISCVCFLIPSHPQMKKFQIFLRVSFWSVLAFSIFILSPYGESIIRNLPDGILKQYQKNRFLSAIDPFIDQYGIGYQLINGLISFATGGFFGRGFGNSIRKYTDFPAANTDFILAIVVEELGFAGFFFLFGLYFFIIIRLFYFAFKIKSEKAKIILVGTVTYLLIHIIFNIGGVTGLLPLTGIPLLMVSAGGSSTMSFMCCIGISQAVISAYRRGEIA